MGKKHHGPLAGIRGGGLHRGRMRHKKSAWFSEMIAQRGPRIERGETRYLILDALKENPRHGYGIMQAIHEKTNGAYRPSPGTVYPALQTLEDLTLIRADGEGKRKVYGLTEKGRELLESQRPALEAFYEDAAPNPSPEQDAFFEQMHQQLMTMVQSIARALHQGRLGADEVGRINDVLSRATNEVKKILTSSSK